MHHTSIEGIMRDMDRRIGGLEEQMGYMRLMIDILWEEAGLDEMAKPATKADGEKILSLVKERGKKVLG